MKRGGGCTNACICMGTHSQSLLGWLVVLRINVDLAIFQPYLDLEAGDNQYLKIQVARPGIEPRSSCSASQELNHSATAAPVGLYYRTAKWMFRKLGRDEVLMAQHMHKDVLAISAYGRIQGEAK